MVIKDYSFKISPQEGFCIIFSDETAQKRSKEEINEMIVCIREVANRLGYDIQSWGNVEGIKRLLGVKSK